MANRNRYVQWAIKQAKKWGFPVGVLLAQINQESGFNPNAKSSAGAQGIGQFMPGTWAGLMRRYGLKGSPWDPYLAISVMARYMAGLYKQYGNIYDPLSVYNSGQPWSRGQHIGQTNAYVHSILSASKSYGKGFDPKYTPPSGPPPGTSDASQASVNQQVSQQVASNANDNNAAVVAAYTSSYSPDVGSTLPGIYAPGQVPADADVSPRQMSDTWQLIASQPLASQESQIIYQRIK